MSLPALTATLLTFAVVVALVGMLFCSGAWDIAFFCIALTPVVWGILSARNSTDS